MVVNRGTIISQGNHKKNSKKEILVDFILFLNYFLAANSNRHIPISLHPDDVNLGCFKL